MAEGEEPFSTDFPIREHNLDYDDDEQEVDTLDLSSRGRLQLPITAESNMKCKP